MTEDGAAGRNERAGGGWEPARRRRRAITSRVAVPGTHPRPEAPPAALRYQRAGRAWVAAARWAPELAPEQGWYRGPPSL